MRLDITATLGTGTTTVSKDSLTMEQLMEIIGSVIMSADMGFFDSIDIKVSQ